MDPLAAGIALIPFGIGIMIAGFAAGALADKVGVRNMAVAGPMLVLGAVIGLSQLDKHSDHGGIGGLLFLAGMGVGLFQSPNGMANMLSVLPSQRGVAAAISMLTLMFCAMVGIVVTFAFVLNSMDQKTLFILFIYGGSFLPDSAVRLCLNALANDYYILMAACLCASMCAAFIPGDFSAKPPQPAAPPQATPTLALSEAEAAAVKAKNEAVDAAAPDAAAPVAAGDKVVEVADPR